MAAFGLCSYYAHRVKGRLFERGRNKGRVVEQTKKMTHEKEVPTAACVERGNWLGGTDDVKRARIANSLRGALITRKEHTARSKKLIVPHAKGLAPENKEFSTKGGGQIFQTGSRAISEGLHVVGI